MPLELPNMAVSYRNFAATINMTCASRLSARSISSLLSARQRFLKNVAVILRGNLYRWTATLDLLFDGVDLILLVATCYMKSTRIATTG